MKKTYYLLMLFSLSLLSAGCGRLVERFDSSRDHHQVSHYGQPIILPKALSNAEVKDAYPVPKVSSKTTMLLDNDPLPPNV